jgi:hypothetical protein
MTEQKGSPYQPRVIATNEIGVHHSLGLAAQTCSIGIKRPMPCIVILVHGVNDVGEAYQNQEKGIIAGLSKRLNRADFYPHEWRNFMLMHNEGAQQKIKAPGRSPIIPFYWGYKPVTHDDYIKDQQKYRDELKTLRDDAKLPYDAYQEDDPKKMAAQGNDGSNPLRFQNDSFKNALDANFAKNGGTFANATTSIPDMLGPGSGGAVLAPVGFATLYMNGGDYTHPIYPNPHRIYQFFAAQRLADLIMQIRNEPVTAKDVINVVAHSQGTIITMLANMLVKQAGGEPANCVIMNHSPYSLESRISENLQEGNQQTTGARQKTFRNFCNLMATQYRGGQHTEEEITAIESLCALPSAKKNQWHTDPRYSRNNNGRVFNYFCADDDTVSLQNVQGIGWRGVPQTIAQDIPNLYQRVFVQHGEVGKAPDGQPFVYPIKKSGDFSTASGINAAYYFRDVIPNGEELPEPFKFVLQGQNTNYAYAVDPDSPDQTISYSAKAGAISRTDKAVYQLDKYDYRDLMPGSVLIEQQLIIESISRKKKIIKGVITGTPEYRGIQLTWLKSREELEKEWLKTDPVGYSQHSSIVMSEFAPSHAMAFDLAIGQCKSFDYQEGKFWESLLHRADWRDPLNPSSDAKNYYRTGKLNVTETKDFMNRPDEIKALPKGDFGVDNGYGPREKPYARSRVEIEMGLFPAGSSGMVTVKQWEMPTPFSDSQLKA